MLETFLVRTQLYIYSQVIPFGSFATGEPHQFPLIWESALVSMVMIPAGVLLYRDDTGRTQAEKLAQRVRLFRSRPALGTFLVMFAVINVAYFFGYGGGFARHPLDPYRDVGRVSVAVPRSEGVRPERLLRGERPARAVLPRDLVRMGERATRRPAGRGGTG